MKKLSQVLAFLMLACLVSAQSTVYVKTDGVAFTAAANHTSWATATNDLQAAISAMNAASGGNVWVKEGTYKPTTGVDRTIAFTTGMNVNVYGGFQGNETDINQRVREDLNANDSIEPWEFTYPSIISGDIGVEGDQSDNSYMLIDGNLTDRSTVFNGFTIENSYDERSLGDSKNATAIATLTACVFSNNYAYWGAAAELCVLDSCLIENNTSESGAVYKSTVSNSTFRNNEATDQGGAAYDVELTNCIFSGNTAIDGGAVSNSTLINCELYDNTATEDGGAAFQSTLTDCDIYNNIAVRYGGGSYYGSSLNCTFRDNLSHNSGGGSYAGDHTNSIYFRNESVSGGATASSNLFYCTLYNNASVDYAGGAGWGTSRNTLIYNNTCYGDGGGVYSGQHHNATIVNNYAANDGGGAYWATLTNSIVWGNNTQVNYGTVTYSAVQDGSAGTGNVVLSATNGDVAGPLFKNPSDSVGAMRTPVGVEHILKANWQISAGSVCSDVADNSALIATDTTDLNGQARIINLVADMGAYEAKKIDGSISTPSYTIDYINEETNEAVSSDIEYAYTHYFDTVIYGENSVLTLEPIEGESSFVYFRESTDTSVSNTFALELSARPVSDVQIDFTNEILTNVDANAEWNASGSFAPLSENEDISALVPSSGNSNETYTVQIPATASSFGALTTQTLEISARPADPLVSIDFSAETITNVAENSEWDLTGSYEAISEGMSIADTIPANGESELTANIRIGATASSFSAANAQSITIPARQDTTEFQIDFINERTKTAIPTAVNYSSQADMTGGMPGDDSFLSLTPEVDVYFQLAATASAFKSEIQHLEVPGRPADPLVSIEFSKEEITNVPANAQWNISGSFEDIANNQSISLNIPENGTGNTTSLIQVVATDTSFSAANTQNIEIIERPANPNVNIDFENESLVNIGDNTEWNASGSFTSIEEAEVITTYIPANGSASENVTVQVVASANSFAAAESQELVIPARPADPSVAINFFAEALTNVSPNAEWNVNTTFEAISDNQDISVVIPGATENDLDVMVRINATDTSFTAESTQSLRVPVRPVDPAVEIDYAAESIVNVAANTQWNANQSDEDITENQDLSSYIPAYGEDNFLIDIFVVASSSSFRAEAGQSLSLKARPAAPSASINFAEEVLEQVALNTQWDAGGSFTSIPAGLSIADYIPEYGEEDARIKLIVVNTDTSFAAVDTQKIAVPGRAKTPAVGTDFVAETMYNVPKNATWTIDGSSVNISEDFSLATYISESQDYQTQIQVPSTDTSFASQIQAYYLSERPAPPTNATVNDLDNTFGWDWSANGFDMATDYEFSIDSGATWTVSDNNPQNVPNTNMAAGTVHVKVKASNESGFETFRSNALLSDIDFTENITIDINETSERNAYTVYPSVNEGRFTVNCPESNNFSIVISNAAGQRVFEESYSSDKEVIDITDQSKGLYLVNIIVDGNVVENHRVIVQ